MIEAVKKSLKILSVVTASCTREALKVFITWEHTGSAYLRVPRAFSANKRNKNKLKSIWNIAETQFAPLACRYAWAWARRTPNQPLISSFWLPPYFYLRFLSIDCSCRLVVPFLLRKKNTFNSAPLHPQNRIQRTPNEDIQKQSNRKNERRCFCLRDCWRSARMRTRKIKILCELTVEEDEKKRTIHTYHKR